MSYQFDASGKLRKLTEAELAEADNDSCIIVENSGTLDDGTPYWAYIAVKPSRYDEFMYLTSQHQTLDLHEYGSILRCGFDAEVPAKVKQEMKEKHGCDDNYLAALAEDVEKAQIAFIKQQETTRLDDIVAQLKKKQSEG